MGTYNFEEDLSVAKESEVADAKLLQNTYPIEIVEWENSTAEWDFKMRWKGRRDYTVEHKEDMLVGNTGNIAVEYACRGSPSGISVSKSDYYLYKLHTKRGIRRFIIKTRELKRLIKEEFYHRKVTGGDEGSDTKMYLFKIKVFEEHATELEFKGG